MDADRTVEKAKEKEERQKVVAAMLRAGAKKQTGLGLDWDSFWNGPKQPQPSGGGFVRG